MRASAQRMRNLPPAATSHGFRWIFGIYGRDEGRLLERLRVQIVSDGSVPVVETLSLYMSKMLMFQTLRLISQSQHLFLFIRFSVTVQISMDSSAFFEFLNHDRDVLSIKSWLTCYSAGICIHLQGNFSMISHP
jgi:hypothetical protein